MARTRGSWNANFAVAAVLVGLVLSFGDSFEVFSPSVSSSFNGRQRLCRTSISSRLGYSGVKLGDVTYRDGASNSAQPKPPGDRSSTALARVVLYTLSDVRQSTRVTVSVSAISILTQF